MLRQSFQIPFAGLLAGLLLVVCATRAPAATAEAPAFIDWRQQSDWLAETAHQVDRLAQSLPPLSRDAGPEAICARLTYFGYPAGDCAGRRAGDSALDATIRSFQSDRGLAVDGVVGPATLRWLNTSAGDLARKLRLNAGRMADLAERTSDASAYVVVNVPDFQLWFADAGRIDLAMPVVVGKPKTPTPDFSTAIEAITVNPSWYVPPGVKRRIVLPKAEKDPDWLSRNGFVVHTPAGARLDPIDVDWSSPAAASVRFVQQPGPTNALGQIKFESPNGHAIYLHDTPSRGLFARNSRAYSSGCVRLSRPMQFARLLLEKTGAGFDPLLIESAQASGRTRGFRLDRKVPLHFVYVTAWIGSNGRLQLRDDLYDRDAEAGGKLAQRAVR